MFDGKMAHWFHPKCFFGRARPKAVGDIAHFDSLRWDDQVFVQAILILYLVSDNFSALRNIGSGSVLP
jgi:hypothetical protein